MANHDIFLKFVQELFNVLQQLYRINEDDNINKIMTMMMMMMMMMMMIILMIINSFKQRNLTHMQGPRSSFEKCGRRSSSFEMYLGGGGSWGGRLYKWLTWCLLNIF